MRLVGERQHGASRQQQCPQGLVHGQRPVERAVLGRLARPLDTARREHHEQQHQRRGAQPGAAPGGITQRHGQGPAEPSNSAQHQAGRHESVPVELSENSQADPGRNIQADVAHHWLLRLGCPRPPRPAQAPPTGRSAVRDQIHALLRRRDLVSLTAQASPSAK